MTTEGMTSATNIEKTTTGIKSIRETDMKALAAMGETIETVVPCLAIQTRKCSRT